MKKTLLSAALCGFISLTSFAQTPCEDGMAGVYPCQDFSLMSEFFFVEVGGEDNGNDCWGWTGPTGREYALFGMANGTSFIEITDPLNPVYIGILETHTTNSLWRDIKVYEDHAFIVSEAQGHGMQVFDLMQLETAADLPVTFEETAFYGKFGNAHNIAINEETGYAYAIGTSTFNGGLHIVNIQDPVNPVIAGDFAEDGYTHDAQIVVYDGPDSDYAGKEICIAFNEDNIAIVDVTNKTDCSLISSVSYDEIGYTHQGWFTEDHRYFLVDDELDEQFYDFNTRTYIYDAIDLDNPVLLGYFESELPAADHNQYVKGNLVFQSNYLGGLRVLDLENIGSGMLEEIAYFDTDPQSDGSGFLGTWSNYPYFESGNIIVSTFSKLFVVRPSDAIIDMSISESTAKTSFSVYPNPTTNELTIQLENFNSSAQDVISIIDIEGRVVKEINTSALPFGTITLDVSYLSEGMYLVRFNESGLTQRFIKG
ncbi:MAG: choice-of-anchor B family protein [Flavobacteriales bacterium]|nr:choice-of-anchor B family protein [Flavobacteriales bacterium]